MVEIHRPVRNVSRFQDNTSAGHRDCRIVKDYWQYYLEGMGKTSFYPGNAVQCIAETNLGYNA